MAVFDIQYVKHHITRLARPTPYAPGMPDADTMTLNLLECAGS